MPLILNKIINNEIHFCIWQIEESLEVLSKIAGIDINDTVFPEGINHEKKKIEYLAGKILTEQACLLNNIDFNGIIKDENGKPFLENSEWQMSISHTTEYIGVVLRKNLEIGLDLEKPRYQILKILPRIFTEQEIAFVGENLFWATIYWSAKEALYKLYGKRKVDFKENLGLKWTNESLKGIICMPDHLSEHTIYYENLENYLVTIAY